jgi:1,4-alpha-glucan branching enzyme
MMITSEDAAHIAQGTHHDPFAVLGRHLVNGKHTIRVFAPGVDKIDAIDVKTGRRIVTLSPVDEHSGMFAGVAARRKNPFAYKLRLTKGDTVWTREDPYRFGPVLGELDEHLIGEGAHLALWTVLGAHVMTHEKVAGTHFAVWAPNARRVSVVGNFNDWDGRVNAMRPASQTAKHINTSCRTSMAICCHKRQTPLDLGRNILRKRHRLYGIWTGINGPINRG